MGTGISVPIEVSVEDVCNLYPEVQDSSGPKSQVVLQGSPGTRFVHDFANGGPVRGAIEIEAYAYYVSAQTLFQQDPAGVYRICDTGPISDGNVSDDGQVVEFAASETQLLIVSAGLAYVVIDRYLQPVPDPPWSRAVDCVYIDGYFVVLDDTGNPTGGQFFISTDALTWDPLDFSNAPASNNKLLALAVDHDELWIFGSVITQVFYNNGNADFPFVPNQSGIIQQGIAAKATRQQLDNTLFWIGNNKDGVLQAFAADGYTPRRISTHPIERQWQNIAGYTGSDMVSWVFQMDGGAFYHVNSPALGRSWRYDRASGQWHRVARRNAITGVEENHVGNCHIVRQGKHIIGDNRTGVLWELSRMVYVDELGIPGNAPGIPLLAYRISTDGYADNLGVFYKLFELITISGNGDGTEDTPEENPGWMLSWSSDNGHSFGNEFELSSGKAGEYNTRLRKIGCGWARNRVWKTAISAAVPRCIISAVVEFEVGTS